VIQINGIKVAAPDTYEVVIADLDASANRSGNGTLYRDRVAVKRTINLSWLFINSQDLSVLLNSVSSVFFPVTYLDPQSNGFKSGTFYVSDRNQGLAVRHTDGSYTWRDVSLSIVER
jgi:hypothetical protein